MSRKNTYAWVVALMIAASLGIGVGLPAVSSVAVAGCSATTPC
jgi:hypothetical protein